MKTSIIGCGSIGSRLAIKLYQYQLISELHIFDEDIITKEDLPIFSKTNIGCQKIQIVSKYIDMFSHDINLPVIFYHNYISHKVKDYDFVIDCRDDKKININCDLRISIDKNLLILDSRKEFIDYENFYLYMYDKNPLYMDLAISIVCNYMYENIWKTKDLVCYDLKEIINGKEIIL